MIPGDGVGPELCESVKMVFAAAGVPVEWNEIPIRFVIYCIIYADSITCLYENRLFSVILVAMAADIHC